MIKILKIAHHRNGVSGAPFDIVLFHWKEEGSNTARLMQGILFDEEGYCAVLDVRETAKMNIEFAGGNSWRGDHFESELRKAIQKHEKEEEKKFNARFGPQ